MKKITSFMVDHVKLDKGLYVSRIDRLGDQRVTTLDLRMKKPNQERLAQESVHTLEHLLATFFRNDALWGQKVVYFGPMGCLTGMYLLLHGEYTSKEVLPFVMEGFAFAASFTGAIPGVSEVECGTYMLHDLEGAKLEAQAYLEVLSKISPSQLTYPQ